MATLFKTVALIALSVVYLIMSLISVALLFCLGSALGERSVITRGPLFAFFFAYWHNIKLFPNPLDLLQISVPNKKKISVFVFGRACYFNTL